jgi:hypothetical protein
VLYSINIKESCSIENPTILLNTSSPPLYNYFYLPDFGRYYFVTGRTFTEGLWNIAGEVDPLASHRAVIMANSGYCMYSASRYNNKIMDGRVQQKSDVSYFSSSVDCDVLGSMTRFIVTTGNSVANLFKVSASDFDTIASAINTATGTVLDNLEKKFGNVSNCLLQAYMMPVNDTLVDALGVAGSAIYLGEYDSTATGTYLRMGYEISAYTYNLAIPWQSTDFRRLSPFSKLSLYLPAIGLVQLSTADFLDVDSIDIVVSVNYRSGELKYRIRRPSDLNEVISVYTTNIKTTIPVTTYQGDTMGQVSGAIALGASAAAAAATGGLSIPIAAGLAGGVLNMTQASLTQTPTVIGGYSGGCNLLGDKSIVLILEYHDSNVEPSTLYPSIGGTLFERVNVGSLSGFAQFNAFTLSGGDNITLAERDRINSFMNGGVFIE